MLLDLRYRTQRRIRRWFASFPDHPIHLCTTSCSFTPHVQPVHRCIDADEFVYMLLCILSTPPYTKKQPGFVARASLQQTKGPFQQALDERFGTVELSAEGHGQGLPAPTASAKSVGSVWSPMAVQRRSLTHDAFVRTSTMQRSEVSVWRHS